MAKAKPNRFHTKAEFSKTISEENVSVMLRLRPVIAAHLDSVRTMKLTKSDYVSALIEADMKKKKTK